MSCKKEAEIEKGIDKNKLYVKGGRKNHHLKVVSVNNSTLSQDDSSSASFLDDKSFLSDKGRLKTVSPNRCPELNSSTNTPITNVRVGYANSNGKGYSSSNCVTTGLDSAFPCIRLFKCEEETTQNKAEKSAKRKSNFFIHLKKCD